MKKKMIVNLFVLLILIFPPIENLDYEKKLRVLTVLDEKFEIDMVSLYNELMLPKN